MKIAIFTGPRTIKREDEHLIYQVVSEVVSRGYIVYVGDAVGVDSAVSSWMLGYSYRQGMPRFSSMHVFEPLEKLGRSPAGLAERSTRMVKEAVHDALQFGSLQCGEILCIGFPNKACPSGIVPAKSWRSGNDEGSGTWSTLALAVGHEIETWIIPIGDLCRRTYQAPWSLDWRIETLFDCADGLHFGPASSLFEVQS